MFGIGGGEILVIALVAVIVFGTDDLPKNMRKFMKALNNFRGVTNDLQRGWLDIRDQVTRDILIEGTDQQKPRTQEVPPDTETEMISDSMPSREVAPVQVEISEHPQNEPSEKSEQLASDLPTPRQAHGVLARGEFNGKEAVTEEIIHSKADPDKST